MNVNACVVRVNGRSGGGGGAGGLDHGLGLRKPERRGRKGRLPVHTVDSGTLKMLEEMTIGIRFLKVDRACPGG